MAERSCRPAFSLPFHGLIVARQVNFSDEVPDQFNLLPAVATRLVWRMDDDFLYKLIDDGGRQFTNAHIFSYNSCKAIKVSFILFKGFYRFPPYLDLLYQFFLFCLIISGEFQEPLMADCAVDVVLINALENAVEFGNAFFHLGNFTLAFLCLFFGFLEVLLFCGFFKSYDTFAQIMECGCNDLRHTEMLAAEFENVTELYVSLDGEEYVFTTTPESEEGEEEEADSDSGEELTWYYNGSEIDVTSLENALAGLNASSFTSDSASGQLEIEITAVFGFDGSPQQVITLYRNDADTCLACTDGQSTAYVPRSSVVDLIEAVNGIVLAG